MAVKIKSPKKLKRDLVIPFEGEEQFVVPKRGGFGQPDMEGYLMVTGGTRQTTLVDPDLDPATSTNSPAAELPSALANTQPTFQQGIIRDGTTQYTTTGQVIQPSPTRTPVNLGVLQPASDTTTDVPTRGLPTFPNWTTLSCSELTSNINYLEGVASSGTWSIENADKINEEIAKGKSLYLSKCSVAPPPTPPVPLPVSPIIGGGGGFGSGGYSEPEVEEIISQSGKGIPLWVVLLIVGGGIYFLSKRKNS